jgi:hypothetical protein
MPHRGRSAAWRCADRRPLPCAGSAAPSVDVRPVQGAGAGGKARTCGAQPLGLPCGRARRPALGAAVPDDRLNAGVADGVPLEATCCLRVGGEALGCGGLNAAARRLAAPGCVAWGCAVPPCAGLDVASRRVAGPRLVNPRVSSPRVSSPASAGAAPADRCRDRGRTPAQGGSCRGHRAGGRPRRAGRRARLAGHGAPQVPVVAAAESRAGGHGRGAAGGRAARRWISG